MMQKYKAPDVKIIKLLTDVICVSGTTGYDETDPYGKDPYGELSFSMGVNLQ